jgi:hypothetical protein
MPLDDAAYVPSIGGADPFIAAVRGGTIYKLDPDTGAKLSSARFFPGVLSPSCVCYQGVDEKIYASYSMELTPQQPVSAAVLKRFLAKIDPSDLSVISLIDISKATKVFDFGFDGPRQGAVELLPGADGVIYIVTQVMSNSLSNAIVLGRLDPANTTQQTTAQPDVICAFTQGAIDTDTGNIWCTDESGPAVANYVPQALSSWDEGFSTGGLAYFAKVSGFSNVSVHIPAGICYDPVRKKMWVTARPTNAGAYNPSANMVLIPVPTNIVPDSNSNIEDPSPLAGIIDLGSTSQMLSCHYRLTANLIYVPCMGDDSVVVVNPADSTKVVKTGFDLPWRMVFTPTKAFAIQQGSAGLKEVT